MNIFDDAIRIVIAEETARQTAEEMTKKLKDKIIVENKEKRPSTTSKYLRNVTLPIDLIDINGSGVLREIFIRSSDKNFTFWLFVDGDIVYNNDWEWFYEISTMVSEIGAFQDDDEYYVLSLSDIKFSSSLIVRIDGNITADAVFYKLEIEKE